MVLAKGHQLCRGKYTIEKVLGRGNFRITYLPRDRKGEPVALKTLKDELHYSQDFERLQQP
ncbi:MAG: hypothetical protein GDA44_05520 [Prochloron sp. SP5CPC1]|nr:hypothetical protein [Candidatus Paraprochloron terpiosi SP5CPC1]